MRIWKILLLSLLFLGISLDIASTLRQRQTETENQLETVKTDNTKNKIPTFDHIFIIVMENRSYEEVVGNSNAPFVNNLIKNGALAQNYYAIAHPSLPNYIALLSGGTYGITSDCTNCIISKTNLIDQLENNHKTWKAYFESLPKSGFLGSQYPYTKKYNSFVYFSDIIKNRKRCQKVVPYSNLKKDLSNSNTTPDFVWISPNLCHDTHYCPVNTGDKWLSKQIPLILTSPAFQNGNSLLIITWDEAERKGKNHVAAIFVGNDVKIGFVSKTYYNHYSLLHTIEASWNMPSMTKNGSKSAIMSDLFSK